MNMREKTREFNLAFGRPVNDTLVELSIEDRILLGNLLLEETVEYITKGLGLAIAAKDMVNWDQTQFKCVPRERDPGVDPVECADGLGDVNVIIHFNAHWQGFDLDAVTDAIHESNMSKLDENGQPLINGITEGYREGEDGFDPLKPIGKILKSVNWIEAGPKIAKIIGKVL